MAFTARTETYTWNVLSSSITVTKPSETTDGDIMFTLVCWYNTFGYTINSVPSGWTLLGEQTGTNYRYALYYKIASSEGASYAWGFSGSVKYWATCSCYTSGDFDGSNPIDVVSNTAYTTSNTTCRAASMTVSAANSPLVFFGSVYNTAAKTFTKPSAPTTDWVEDFDYGSTTPDYWSEICSMIWSSSGSTGDMDATISASLTTKHAFAVALNPASGGSSGPANLKTFNGLAKANIKTINGLAIASIKSVNGLT